MDKHPLKWFLTSPPFGNYISHPNCERVLGSFTLRPRPGLVWNTLKTLRPIRGGWVNRIGLRNPGIMSLAGKWDRGNIYSIVGMEPNDWSALFMAIPDGMTVELNLGCPNVHEYGIDPKVLTMFPKHFRTIVKLPATDMIDKVADMAVEAGVDYLHVSNTIPTDRGGESGKRLKERNIPIIERLSARYQDVPIIAGGGIYSIYDVGDYEKAGARHFSLSTAWFRPWRALKIVRD